MARLDLPQMELVIKGLASNCLTLREAWLLEAMERFAQLAQMETQLPESLTQAVQNLHLLEMEAAGPM